MSCTVLVGIKHIIYLQSIHRNAQTKYNCIVIFNQKGIYKDVLVPVPRLIFVWSSRCPRWNVCSPSLALLVSQIHFICMTSIKIYSTKQSSHAKPRGLLLRACSKYWWLFHFNLIISIFSYLGFNPGWMVQRYWQRLTEAQNLLSQAYPQDDTGVS